MSDKKRILKEFQWFEVQTKVREIISEVLLPLEKKLQTNSNAISRLQQNNRQQQHKIQQLSLLVHNDQDIFKNGIFSSVQNKFDEQAILIKTIQSKIGYLQTHVSEKVAVLDKRLEESSQVLGKINHFKDYVKTQLEDQSKKIVESKANLMESFEEINKEISQLSIKLQRLSAQHQIQAKRTTIIQQNFSKSSQSVKQQVQSFYSLLKQIKIQEQINSSRIIQNKQDIVRLSVYQKMMSKLQSLVNEQMIRIDNLQYKIEVIQPLVSFSQINQYAHHILPQKFHRNISVYYYNRYNELIQQILNTQFNERRMKQSVKGNLNLVKQAHKRSIKVVFKLKKQFLQRKGIDIDNLSHEKKQEQLASIKLSQDFKGIEDNEHEQPKQVVAPVSDAKVAKELVDALGRELTDRIQAQMKDSKSYIHSMEQLLKKQIEQIDNSLKKTIDLVQDIQMNFQLQQNANKDYISSAALSDKHLKQDVKSIKSILKQLYQMISIYNQIQRQDEKDRQSIILLGVKEKHRDEITESRRHQNTTVDLSKQCLSCSGNPNYFNQFFKMACLTYTSSPLSIDNKTIQRLQILNKLSQQLQQLKGTFFTDEIKAIPLSSHKKSKNDEPNLYNQFASSQIMSVPQRQQISVSDRFSARNTSSSQQMRPNIRSPQQPRIINPSQLTQQVLARTRTRLFSRKLQRSYRQSRSKNEKDSKDRTEFMGNVGRYFHKLSSKHDLSVQK